jgi:hypothetical protein
MIQAMLAADPEERAAAFDVGGVVQPRVTGLELEMVHIRWVRVDVIGRARRGGLRLIHGRTLRRASALFKMMFSEARTMKVYRKPREGDDGHPISA